MIWMMRFNVYDDIWGLSTGIQQKLEVVLEQTLLFKAVNCTSFLNENFTLICLA